MSPKEEAVERALRAWDRFHGQLMALHAPDVAELDLSLAQMKAVYVVGATGPMRMGALAEQLGTALSTTSGVVDRLVQLGLLQRFEDPADRRQVLVRITGSALRQLEDMSEISRDRLRSMLLRLSDEREVRTVERAITLLATAAGDLSEETR